MTDKQPPEDNLADEFRILGNNVLGALRSVWDSPERKRLTEQLETNLNELSATLRKEVESFNDSPTGQRLKEDVDNLQGKVRTEINDSRVKEELLAALRTANEELSKVIQRWSNPSPGSDEAQNPPAGTPAAGNPSGQDEV